MEKELRNDLKTLRSYLSDHNTLNPKIKKLMNKSPDRHLLLQYIIPGGARDLNEFRRPEGLYAYASEKGLTELTLEGWKGEKQGLNDKIETLSSELISQDEELIFLSKVTCPYIKARTIVAWYRFPKHRNFLEEAINILTTKS